MRWQHQFIEHVRLKWQGREIKPKKKKQKPQQKQKWNKQLLLL